MENNDTVVKIDLTQREIIPKGLYKAKISDVTNKSVTNKLGEVVPYFDVRMTINDAKHENMNGKVIVHSIPRKVSFKSKLASLLTQAGVKLDGKESLDVKTSLVGKEVEVYMGPKSVQRKDGTTYEIMEVVSIDFIGVLPRK